ncbi:GIT2 [Cervus elaphus hippelaphus]|uniref:GIT2 n=1 Tax=Cervus elaphus hippelaphus TaxID=46360 RepID=A0A212D7G4_CEREH|nr:GIT2 [Cervus elaphus hippelaphus]
MSKRVRSSEMVETLYNNGANSIWEHSLLDPTSIMSGRRKANPQDKVHPNKAEFIRAKYQMLAFVHRLPCRDDDSVTAKDLSKEKGNTPLHVASKAGQILQAELLAVYGADPGTQDSSGKTPVDYARQGGHHELAERLVEIQYELTDRLAFYLCGRKPDHKNGQHFIIPQMADSLDISELAKAAKKKLQSLSNHLFEELAMDVYDEVDRRETDAVWLATQNHSTLVTETTVVPFLPGRQKLARFNAHEFATLVIDILSDAKRRQQGSPLSSSKDNVELILKTISNQHSVESQDNDQPDYDSVASDEDTDPEATASKAHRQKSLDSDLSDGPVTVQEFLEVKNALVASEAKIQQLMKVNNNLSDELRIMQKKLQTLQSENSNLRKQATTNIYQVQTGSEYTDTSNHSSLKRRPSARGSRPMSMYETGSGQKPYLPMGEVNHPEESRTRLQPFPAHVSNTISASALYSLSSLTPAFPLLSLQIPSLRFAKSGYENRPCVCCTDVSTGACGVPTSTQGPWPKCLSQAATVGTFLVMNFLPHIQNQKFIKVTTGRKYYCLLPAGGVCGPGVQAWSGSLWASAALHLWSVCRPSCHLLLPPCGEKASRLEKQNSTPESDYDNTPNDRDLEDMGSSRKGRPRNSVWQGDSSGPDTAEPHTTPSPILPSTEDVIRKTEQITKNIQELLRAAQENKHDSYIPCSERIHIAVTEMAALFPKKPKSDMVRTSLRLLTSSAYRLQSECKKTLPGDPGPPMDIQLVTQQVIQCAYDIAKAAKQLVTITTKENNN